MLAATRNSTVLGTKTSFLLEIEGKIAEKIIRLTEPANDNKVVKSVENDANKAKSMATTADNCGENEFSLTIFFNEMGDNSTTLFNKVKTAANPKN